MKRRIVTWTTLLLVVLLAAVGMRRYLAPSADVLVRPVKVSHTWDWEFPESSEMTVFQSRAQLEAAYPDARTDPTGAVDFDREDLVQIRWEGHFCRKEAHAWTARAGGRWLMFHEDRPAEWATDATDCFCRLMREEWYAMPKGVNVSMASPEGIALLDSGTVIAFLAVGIGAFAVPGFIGGRRRP